MSYDQYQSNSTVLFGLPRSDHLLLSFLVIFLEVLVKVHVRAILERRLEMKHGESYGYDIFCHLILAVYLIIYSLSLFL